MTCHEHCDCISSTSQTLPLITLTSRQLRTHQSTDTAEHHVTINYSNVFINGSFSFRRISNRRNPTPTPTLDPSPNSNPNPNLTLHLGDLGFYKLKFGQVKGHPFNAVTLAVFENLNSYECLYRSTYVVRCFQQWRNP